MRTFNRLPLSLLNTLQVKSQGKMNITYSLILCATIKECADNYTLEQWASRVDFNAPAITKMLLPISPLCAVEVLRARAQENRRIPGVRALPFGFGFRRSAIVSRVKGGARAPLYSALTSCHGCFVICDHKLLFYSSKCPRNMTNLQLQEKLQRTRVL